MRPLYLLAASTLVLTATACAPKTPPARAALDCPMQQGELSRTSASPDGKVCTYTSAGGAEVTLQLVSTAGGVDQALSGIETTLMAERMKAEEIAAEAAKAGTKDEGAPAKAGAEATKDADRAANEAAEDAKSSGLSIQGHVDGKDGGKDGDSVRVVVGGKTVVKESDDGVVRVDGPGVHIVANDRDDSASVRVGPIHIDANGGSDTVRIKRDVRLRGEGLSPERRGVRATFFYHGRDLPGGYRFVGYEAGGPKRGPITVAVVKSRADDIDDDEIYPAVKRLVRKNGGV